MTRLLAWAQALAGGRRRIVGRWPGASMVLAVRPVARRKPVRRSAAVVHHHHHDHHDHHHDRHLTVARGTPPPGWATPSVVETAIATTTTLRFAGRRVVVAGRPGPAGVIVKIPATRLAATPRAAATAIRDTVAHVAAAHRRVETLAPGALTAVPITADRDASSASARHLARPVPAVAAAHRPAMVLRPPTVVAPPPDTLTTEPEQAVAAPRGSAAATAELDLEALTDRVVRQIDRRIVAHRERLGQI